MKKILGTAVADTDDSLDAMLAIVQQKEEQQRHLDKLKRQREVEEAERRAEIERLRKEREQKIIASIESDIAKYKKIVSSPFGKDMKEAAWKTLKDKYPEAKDLDVGDTYLLLVKLINAGRYIAYANGVVLDVKTGLEWFVGPDRGTSWYEANEWAENLNFAGGGWRMPTKKDLETLYQRDVGTRNMTPLLKTTGWWIWSGKKEGSSKAWYFDFIDGIQLWFSQSDSDTLRRGFAVRSRK